MGNNVVKFEKFTKKESFINLTGIRGKEVSEYWKVEILEGKNRQLQELNYAIKLTSTLNGVSITFSKADIEDDAQSKKIIRRLSGFGKIQTSYLKEIAKSVNEALYSEQDKIIKVADINSVWTSNIFAGVPAEKYYKKFYKHFIDNQDSFPSRSSNSYQHKISHGVILDNKSPGTNNLLVAIKSGVLKKLFSIKSDNQYREVLESLIDMGVLEGEIQEKEVEEYIEIDSSDAPESHGVEASKSVKTIIRTKKKRLDKRIRMNTSGKEANVFIFNIDLEKGE